MDYEIKHTGTITAVDNENRTATVRIADTAASDCAGCAVRSLCQPAGKAKEVTEITVAADTPGVKLLPGMQVEIGMPASGRYKAIATALAIPCALLAATAIALPALGVGQEASALSALAVVAVYYGVLYLRRRSVSNRFRWQLIAVLSTPAKSADN